ncbi:hypothetical protein [Cupriavidus sp. UME77]|uniref:hypothetical protein n=1 Tax=Cupriavidus sp. UME77 TaxID=1862321 RepID=UPI001600D67B|nr:hypothetical protein [Cupriavidus sp. UME77]
MNKIIAFYWITKGSKFCRHATRTFRLIFFALFIELSYSGYALAAPSVALGDYSAEPRIGDHVDSDRLVQRLVDLHANTYMWLVWRSKNDWEDLKAFLPKAKMAGINVWVYLVPPSETPVQDKRFTYSEPFRLDYVRWAEEIAKLSIEFSNLNGYVIDDFWGNVRLDRFSREYIGRVVDAGKAINAKIRFYPLMYFNQIDEESTEFLAPFVDGVIGAYPRDRAELERALTFLEDRFLQPSGVKITFPGEKSSRPGDHGLASQKIKVLDNRNAKLRFHYRTNLETSTVGYHRLQVRVDDEVIWDEDAASHNDGVVTIDISKALRGKRTARLSFGVFDIKGVGNFGLIVKFSGLNASGIELRDSDLGGGSAWSSDIVGGFSVKFEREVAGKRRFRLPMIVMPSGDAAEYRMRYAGDGTPVEIAGKIKELTDFARDGKIEGIVTYCLDKSDRSESFDSVRDIFESVRRPIR